MSVPRTATSFLSSTVTVWFVSVLNALKMSCARRGASGRRRSPLLHCQHHTSAPLSLPGNGRVPASKRTMIAALAKALQGRCRRVDERGRRGTRRRRRRRNVFSLSSKTARTQYATRSPPRCIIHRASEPAPAAHLLVTGVCLRVCVMGWGPGLGWPVRAHRQCTCAGGWRGATLCLHLHQHERRRLRARSSAARVPTGSTDPASLGILHSRLPLVTNARRLGDPTCQASAATHHGQHSTIGHVISADP